MKKISLFLAVLSCQGLAAQLYVAPGDSISVLPGTLFTLQEDLINNGKIYSNGVLTLNGTATQNISGSGNTDNITAANTILMQSDAAVNNVLQLDPGSIFSLGNYQLTNSGSVSGIGLLRGSVNAALILNGNSSVLHFDQSIDAATNALRNFIVNNSGATVQNKLYVYDALVPNAGIVTLNDEIILRSNNSKTARVAPASSNFIYNSNGKFVIERYIPGRRAWRLLTAPVTTASAVKISDAWQDGKPRVTNINIISNPEPGFGTHVTYGFPSTNGYDQGINGNPSIRYLTATGWNGVPAATNDGSTLNSGTITDQPGYMLFVRGDRGTLLSQATGAATTPTVLRPKGKINTGVINQPLGTSFINGGSTFRVVGNPYPSSVNFHSIITNPVNAANGFADAFYLWDPNITGSNGVGGFVGMTYNSAASIAAGKPVYDRSVASSIDNSGDIQSSAAFVIDYSGAATSMQMLENNKAAGSNNTFFRPLRQLQTTLLAENTDSSTSINDGVLASFDEYNSNEVDNADMKKLGNFAENICILNNAKFLCIEKRKPVSPADTIFYFMSRLRQKKYQLQFEFANNTLPNGIAPYLEDKFLHTKTPLHTIDTTWYGFTVSTDTSSASSHRFRIVFKEVNSIFLYDALLLKEDVQLHWSISDTCGIVSYEVQRSIDSLHFSTMQLLGTATYTATSNIVLPGIFYYRIKCISNKGVVSYSNIVKLVIADNSNNMFVFPNPITDGKFTLTIKDAVTGMYELRLLNAEGKSLFNKNFQQAGGRLQLPVTIPAVISNGIYPLEVNMPGKKQQVLKLVIQQQ